MGGRSEPSEGGDWIGKEGNVELGTDCAHRGRELVSQIENLGSARQAVKVLAASKYRYLPHAELWWHSRDTDVARLVFDKIRRRQHQRPGGE